MSSEDDVRDRLRLAAKQYHAVRASLENARDELRPLVVEALKQGVMQKDVITDSGLTREYVRRLARAAGIERAN
jgi:hypothetical protein